MVNPYGIGLSKTQTKRKEHVKQYLYKQTKKRQRTIITRNTKNNKNKKNEKATKEN